MQNEHGAMESHWWLEHKKTGEIIDLTADQFEVSIPYEKGRGRGFLTGEPCGRAQEFIESMEWEGA